MKMKPSTLLTALGLLWSLSSHGQERPTPKPPPTYIPAAPPLLAEMQPFPSNTDGEIAIVAHLFDPKENRLIISVDSISNDRFILQRSEDLVVWSEEEESKDGNKGIITFFVPLKDQPTTAFFRIVKQSP